MSYTRSDAAVDLCYQYAEVDLASLDPDETAELTEQFIRECREIRDGYDENGYASE